MRLRQWEFGGWNREGNRKQPCLSSRLETRVPDFILNLCFASDL